MTHEPARIDVARRFDTIETAIADLLTLPVTGAVLAGSPLLMPAGGDGGRPFDRCLAPRPLPLHLGTAALTWSAAAMALAGLDGRAEVETLLAPLQREAEARFRRLVAGIERYHRHPAHRTLEEPRCAWREGGSRLLDYGRAAADDAPAVLVVPSLVNRYYVLDLHEEASFVRALACAGLRPLVVDWGAPGDLERRFDLADYVGRLQSAFDAAVELSGRRIALLGYCMGGLLATALALRNQERISALTLLATPWDFHAAQPHQARLAAACLPLMEPLLATAGAAPTDLLQTLFFALDPLGVARKFMAFGALASDDHRLAPFVLLEDWLADGVPVAAPVFRECLAQWFGENRPGRREWTVGGDRVDPARLACPTLVVVPHRDRIVPPPSAAALAAIIPNAETMRPATGHVGMVAGRTARDAVAAPVAAWLLARA